MANGSLTGLVVHVSDTATCVAPIINVRVIEEAVVVLPTSAQDLATEQGRENLYSVSQEGVGWWWGGEGGWEGGEGVRIIIVQ